jgi:hypothetical protein
VNIGNTRSGLNVAGVITSNTNSLVTNSSTVNCCCVPMPPPCDASFNVNTTYCKSSSIAVNSATVANGIFNKWEVFEANGNCTALTSALLEYTSNTLNLSLSMPVFLEGHCYQLKHSVLWGTNLLCASSLCFCVAAPSYIYDTICAQGSYYWALNGTTYNTSGIYTYTTTTPNACEIHVLNVTITNLAALHFDGVNDYVSVPHNTSLPFDTSSFTIECWTKFDMNNSTSNQTIFCKYNYVLNKGLALYVWTNNNTSFIALDYNGISVARQLNLNIYDNLWHHIALVRSGNLFYFYVDGAQIGTSVNFSFVNNYMGLVDFTCITPMYIGTAFQHNFNTHFDPMQGAIDELRIWGYARTLNQLQNSTLCDLKAQYKLYSNNYRT